MLLTAEATLVVGWLVLLMLMLWPGVSGWLRRCTVMLDGTAVERPQDLSQGRYFGGRRPEDGRIPPHASARQIHDLVRAVAPPYPPAFASFGGQRIFIERTMVLLEPRSSGSHCALAKSRSPEI